MKSRYGLLITGLLLMAFIGVATAANITFQVNMAVQERLGNFNPATDTVLVRGSINGWAGYDDILTTTLPDSVYRITLDLDSGAIEFKYVLIDRVAGDDRWESVDNRAHNVTGDETLDVVYFNNQGSSSAMDLEVLYRVDMRVQIATGAFDPNNDVVMVRGGTPPLEWGGDANQLPEVTGSPGLYSDWVQFDAVPYPGTIDFKYVILTNGDPENPIWETPTGGGNRQVVYDGTEPDDLPPPSGNGYQETMLDTVFFSDVTFEDITENPVDVIFTCDVRPAYLAIADIGYIIDVQTGEDTVRVIEGVGINGLWNNWTWGSIPQEQQMHDDGVAPDEIAGDSIWTVSIHFEAGTARPHPYKYGANDYDNEAGFGADHTLMLDDSSPTMILPVDCWGELGDIFDDYLWVCGDAAEPTYDAAIPDVFTLYQNYPNPFNPTTQISFSLPSPEQVTFKVFNVLGQEVAKMDLGPRAAGLHHIHFSAENLSTGLYFYSVEAGSMHAVRKMLVLK